MVHVKKKIFHDSRMHAQSLIQFETNELIKHFLHAYKVRPYAIFCRNFFLICMNLHRFNIIIPLFAQIVNTNSINLSPYLL